MRRSGDARKPGHIWLPQGPRLLQPSLRWKLSDRVTLRAVVASFSFVEIPAIPPSGPPLPLLRVYLYNYTTGHAARRGLGALQGRGGGPTFYV